MKRVFTGIVLICFMITSLCTVGFAENAAVETYVIEGNFEGAKAGDIVSVFVLKDGTTMSSLKAMSGSAMDNVYLIDTSCTDASGDFSISVTVNPEALDKQCMLYCNGESRQGLLRSFIENAPAPVSLVYASPGGTSGASGTPENPCNLSGALTKAVELANSGNNVDICLLGGTYNLTSNRVYIQNKNPAARITYRPATAEDKVVFSGMKRIPSANFEKVTNAAVLSRLPENARGSVYSIDLVSAGIDASHLSFKYAGDSAEQRSFNPPAIYLNGKKQRISQYPNEGYFTTGRDSTGVDGEGHPQLDLSELSDIDVSKWVASRDNAYLTGFLFDSYRAGAAKLLDINTSTNKLTLDGTTELYYQTDGSWMTGYSYHGPRAKIVNLLEEMDIPGEWCIDQDTNVMYYFAPHAITGNDVFEMPAKSSTYPQIVFIQNSSNITFKNIEFRGTRTHEAVYLSNVNGIQIIDCTIHASAKAGITGSGVKNTLVDGCNVYDTGTSGITISGDVAVRESVSVPSGNIISNNHVYNFSQNPTWGSSGQGITINRTSSNSKSLGDVIQNNLIHGCEFIGAVRYGGLDIQVKRNEMYNLLDSVDDAGVIYSGRTFNEFGNTISENYIHDYSVIRNARYVNMGIYWDDHISGQTAERNIIVSPNPTRSTILGIRTIGYGNVIKNNTFVDAYYAMRLGDRGTVNFASSDPYNLYASLSALPHADYSKYADMVAFKNVLDANNKKMVYKAVAEKNLTVNCANPVYYSPTYYNQAESEVGNVTADANVFADGEYLVKASAATEGTAFAEVPNENNFDMDLIGIQKEVPFTDNEFSLLYPVNNTKISENNVVLTWEQAVFADEYEYVIANDAELTDVVSSGTTKNNFVIPEASFENGTYYWKVTAVNTSRNMGRSWENENEVQSFEVSEDLPIEIMQTSVTSNDVVIDSFNNVKDFDVTCTIYNKTDEDKDFVALAALYTSGGELLQVEKSASVKRVSAGNTSIETFEFTNENVIADENSYVKIFVFESLTNILPLSYSAEALRK